MNDPLLLSDEERIGQKRRKKISHFNNFFDGSSGGGGGGGGGTGGSGTGGGNFFRGYCMYNRCSEDEVTVRYQTFSEQVPRLPELGWTNSIVQKNKMQHSSSDIEHNPHTECSVHDTLLLIELLCLLCMV